jgi:hypothetical protein
VGKRGASRCPLCETDCGKGSAFCHNCGWQLGPPEKSLRPLRAAAAGLVLTSALVGVAVFGHRPATLPAPPIPARETFDVNRIAEGDWPCYLAAEAFNDVAKWIVTGDKREVTRRLRESHSIHLTSGLEVKVLAADFGRLKIRVPGSGSGGAPAGQECWVATEAISDPGNR